MKDETFESGLELVILEGGGKDQHFHLNRTRITLGRLDANETPGIGTLAVPDPTVSRVHAVMEWDPKRNRYLLVHRSRTNHTVLNGKVMEEPTYVHVGDRIKMGSLVAELRLITKAQAVKAAVTSTAAESVASEFHLLILNGPDGGSLHPLNKSRLLLREPGGPQQPLPEVAIPGLGPVQAVLILQDGQFHVTTPENAERSTLLDSFPGIVRQRQPGLELGLILCPNSVLVAGAVAMLIAPADQVADMRAQLLDGHQVHPLQTGLFREGDRLWNHGEQHVLKVISGPQKGTHLWLDLPQLQNPITIGRSSSGALLELPDRGAAQAEIFQGPSGLELRNTDQEIGLGHNWDEVTPGEEAPVVSGDRFRLGRTVIRYEFLPVQALAETLALRFAGEELPLQREVNLVGYSPASDLRINDRRLGPTHGRLVVRPPEVIYQHRQGGSSVRIGDVEVRAGEERALPMDVPIQLADGIEVTLTRKTGSSGMTDGMLIGPTQEQIEASRQASD